MPPSERDTMSDRNGLRTTVRGLYDLQKLRIEKGNRIIANWKAKLGMEPGKKEEDTMDEDGKEILETLRTRFRKIMDAFKSKYVRDFPTRSQFQGDELISHYTEIVLLDSYFQMEDQEKKGFARLKQALEEFPIWTKFLKDVKGCGPAMAAVIISEFDIHKAKYRSSLWAYAGLDVVTFWQLQKTIPVNVKTGNADWNIPVKIGSLVNEGEYMIDGTKDLDLFRAEGEAVKKPDDLLAKDTGRAARVLVERDGSAIQYEYRMFSLGGRSRRKEHLVDRVYTTARGQEATRKSITFSPFIKTKLMGVLAGSFLKANSPYREFYDDYKHRLESRPDLADGVLNDKGEPKKGVKAHRHAMSLRYMIKQFLADLYVEWRTLEGLEVHNSYLHNKLGHVHGGEAA